MCRNISCPKARCQNYFKLIQIHLFLSCNPIVLCHWKKYSPHFISKQVLSSGHISLLIVRSFSRKFCCWLNVLQKARLKIILQLGNHFNVTKGQLISKCPFGAFISTKIYFFQEGLLFAERTLESQIENYITTWESFHFY